MGIIDYLFKTKELSKDRPNIPTLGLELQIGQDQNTAAPSKSFSKEIITPSQIFPKSQLNQLREYFDQAPYLASQRLNTNIFIDGLRWYDYLRYKDPVISACTEFRVSRILNTPYQIISDDNDELCKQAASLVEDVLFNVIGSNGGLSFEQSLKYLLEALPKGYSVIECVYDHYQNYYVPARLEDKDQSNFEFNYLNELRWVSKWGDYNYQGQPLPKNKFIVHVHDYSMSFPYGKSIYGEKVFWSFYLKWKAIENGVSLIDRYSKPYMWGKYPAQFDEQQRKQFLDDLAAMGKRRAGVSEEGTDIQVLEVSSSGKDIIHSYITDRNHEIAIAILGQALTLSSEGGGSYARDQVAFDISDIIFKEDIKELENTLNKWIGFFVRLNFPVLDTIPYIKFDIEDPIDQEKQLKIYIDSANAGVPVSISQVMEDMGIRQPTEDEPTLTKQTTQSEISFPPVFKTKPESKLQATQRAARIDANKMRDFEDQEMPSLAKLYEPVFNDIVKKTRNVENASQVLNITIDPKLLNSITNKYFDDIAFSYLYGNWSQKKMNKGTQDKIQRINNSAQMDLFNYTLLAQTPTRQSLSGMLPFREALTYFQDKIAIPPEFVSQLEEQMYAKAFWISRATSYKIVLEMQKLIEKAIQQGYSPREFIRTNRQQLENMGFSTENPWYLNTVYRTNTNLSYNSGQYQQLTNQITKDNLQFWEYVAVLDDRTSPFCERYNGLVFMNDDPIWNIIYPPNHFNCRSTVTAIDRDIMREEGLKLSSGIRNDSDGEPILPDQGFQRNDASDYLSTEPRFSFEVPAGWGISS